MVEVAHHRQVLGESDGNIEGYLSPAT